MQLDLLRTFLAVHRAGSFTRAAGLLGLSQPAVTGQIRSLEKQVGAELFVREARGARPTGPADRLAALVAPHLDALESALAGEPDEQALGRTLHLGGPAEFLAARVIPALADLVGQGCTLRVTLGLAGPLLDGLAAGHHDLVVSTVRPRRKGLSITPLADEELLLVGTPTWRGRLTGAGGPDVAALDRAPMVAYAEELPLVRRYWLAVFGRRPAAQPAVVVPDLRGVLAAVASGAGVSVLPDYLARDLLDSGDLVVIHQPALAPINTLYLATRAGSGAAPHVRLARAQLLARAAGW
jgi:DNA-binding transcriptional LysR family regulator